MPNLPVLTAPAKDWQTGRLHSWKEIASFFRKEVRTVQLWEKNEGLPIHRQHHKKLGSVYAYRRELEAWWLCRSALPPATVANTENTPAHHACMLGLYFSNQRTRADLLKALTYFEEAIQIDPSCADAYAGLTDIYVALSYSHCMPARQAMQSAQQSITKALLLNPESIRVRLAEINFNKTCGWNWPAAELACRKLVDAGHVLPRTLQLYADLMIKRGLHQDSVSLALQAHRLDPLSDIANAQVSFAYFYAGDYANAISFIQNSIRLKPRVTIAHALLGRAEAQRGNWDQAIQSFERALALSTNSTFLKALLAYGYAGRGDTPVARNMLSEIESQHTDACFPAVDVSAVHTMLNQQSQALACISRAYDLRDIKLAYIQHDPRFAPLRTLPQFQQIASSISLCAT